MPVFFNFFKLPKFKAVIIASSAAFIFSACLFAGQIGEANALTDVEQLQQQIDAKNANIAQLNKEIQQYSELVDKTSKEAQTLQAKIKSLEANARAINSDIKKTTAKIDVANLTIKKLGLNINESEAKIKTLQNGISKSVQDLRGTEDTNLMETLLSGRNLSEVLVAINTQLGFNDSLQNLISQVRVEKKKVETSKVATETQKKTLVTLKNELSGKKQAVDSVKSEQNQILTTTKNQEKAYQQTLQEKQALKAAFEKEVFEYEAKLKYKLDPNSLPSAGSSPLSWPLDNVYITQLFGKTVGASKLYVSGSHNGVDFRAPVGTAVKAAAGGVVIGAGDTDLTCRGASFGRWVLIKHNNGLASIYAHLSVIGVSEGQRVNVGDTVGYSGNTGYSTGPHLHVSVYAADAVQVQNRPSVSCGGKVYRMPIAALNAYLDPMLYFPPYNK